MSAYKYKHSSHIAYISVVNNTYLTTSAIMILKYSSHDLSSKRIPPDKRSLFNSLTRSAEKCHSHISSLPSGVSSGAVYGTYRMVGTGVMLTGDGTLVSVGTAYGLYRMAGMGVMLTGDGTGVIVGTAYGLYRMVGMGIMLTGDGTGVIVGTIYDLYRMVGMGVML